MLIELKSLVNGMQTYPTWSSGAVYNLQYSKLNEEEIEVFYIINKGVTRKISRIFPPVIICDETFCWTLGLIKGEGSNSLGKSNYRRFTFTNSNPELINIILNELDKKGILRRNSIMNKAFHVLHFQEAEKKVVGYWAKKLGFSEEKFKCFDCDGKTSKYGVCHLYISDTLLRRIIDLINERIMS